MSGHILSPIASPVRTVGELLSPTHRVLVFHHSTVAFIAAGPVSPGSDTRRARSVSRFYYPFPPVAHIEYHTCEGDM